MQFGVVRFPGSNCERDCIEVVTRILGLRGVLFDYRETPNLKDVVNCLIIPGGFSFGDYLRAGAVAKASPIMNSIKKFAEQKGLIIGICNGFQILTEAGLLPGVLLNNSNSGFICQDAQLRVVNNNTAFTNLYNQNEIISMPIAHAMGNYNVTEAELVQMRVNNQIILEYTNNINGSTQNIAGICNKTKNVFGLMPHPERCCESDLGGIDGLRMFQSILKNSMVAV
ncbi:MAG: phosphoribosylformylglycinamidine synthase subunit PurQ [Candidatus Caenarcaniphilales bacterium]|nr:phosphoribosylformylglycinamidine synthase subunit PurQ [Candidatus Caenarcaniphilales bacterium]